MIREFLDPTHFAAALNEHDNARRFAHACLNAGRLVEWYRSGSHGMDPTAAGDKAAQQAYSLARHGQAEREALVSLNSWCLRDGAVAGDEVVLAANRYRVVNPGNPAVYLGCEVPDDALEALEALDEALTAEDERREWAGQYNDSIRTEAR